MEATKRYKVCGVESLGDELEATLAAYRESLGGSPRGVPRELLVSATPISARDSTVHRPGPPDAAAAQSDSEASAISAEGVDAHRPSASSRQDVDSSAAIVGSGLDEACPLQMWNYAMERYGVMTELGRKHGEARDDVAARHLCVVCVC